MERLPGKVIIITFFFFFFGVSKCAVQNEGYRWWILWEFTVGKLRQAFMGAVGLESVLRHKLSAMQSLGLGSHLLSSFSFTTLHQRKYHSPKRF